MSRYKNLIKTAQFAKLCNVSKQTLIYYDKMEIFHPHYVDEKGYRYYSLSQCEAFMVIAMLRELDTSLKEIREYLENKSTYSFLELLDKKQKEVNKRMKELKEIAQMIEERKNMTKEGMTINNIEKIHIVNMPEEKIIISDYVRNYEEVEHEKAISNLEKYMRENNSKSFCIGAIVEKSELLAEQDYNVAYFYAKTNILCKNTVIKPEGLYAIAFHKGHYDTTYLTYKRLMKYIKLNDYVIVGNAYEEALMDTCTQKSEEEHLMKISIQVEKSKNDPLSGVLWG
ncbi:MAG: MerR family transcriptional regulator [Anaeromicrobium sp.]|uniref:MerR family transcriptional regulator n=1 Tax=Anaeromicrobium sp. TaxID=1929132 RepID=UPI0025E18740|nr:MerR family transcriptional regulator [Anaeromicrobium sp.]MCT4593070.1 MerR family transcriptional regulator [Anaeromicrobium sp.]